MAVSPDRGVREWWRAGFTGGRGTVTSSGRGLQRRWASIAVTAGVAVLGVVAVSAAPPAAGAPNRTAPAGAAVSWGDNVSGELGVGTGTNSATPLQVAGLAGDVAAVAAGSTHSLALTTHGGSSTVWAWGANDAGQLGNGTTATAGAPERVHGLNRVGCPTVAPLACVPIAGGGAHSLAIDAPDGSVFAWGANNYGQLGDGTSTDRPAPAPVKGLGGVVAVAAGGAFSVALRQDGTVWVWGDNGAGEEGTGTRNTDPNPVPVQVPGLDHVVAVSAGLVHVMALRDDGSVWTWGGNNFGQQGRGTPGQANLRPGVVPGLGPGTTLAIAAGARFSLALVTDGTVLAWGQNNRGQLGNGTIDNFGAHQTPAPVTGLSGVSTIVAGAEHALAVTAAGGVVSWGFNAFSQLGRPSDPGKSYSTLPGRVNGLNDVRALAAGGSHNLAVTAAPGPPAPPGLPLPADPPPVVASASVTPSPAQPPSNVVVTPDDAIQFTEPRLAADPTRPGHLALASATLSADFSTETCWLSLSADGGQSWDTRAMFGPPGAPIPTDSPFCDRPGVAYEPDGTLLYVFKPGDFIYITASSDGGATFAPPQPLDPGIKAINPTERDFWGSDMAVDAQTGDVYVPWERFGEEHAAQAPMFVARCPAAQIAVLLAGGAPACPTHQASPNQAVSGNVRIRITVGPDHRVYLGWGDEAELPAAGVFNLVGPVNIETVSSGDGGATWTLPSIADRLEFVCPQFNCPSTETFSGPFYEMSQLVARGASPRQVSVATSGPRFGVDAHQVRVALSTSLTAGAQWQLRQTVGVIAGDQQHDPELAPGGGGRLALAYYDTKPDASQDTYVLALDAFGRSAGPPRRVDTVPSSEDVFAGVDERIGLVGAGSTFGVAWVDSRRGTPDDGKTDIVFAAGGP